MIAPKDWRPPDLDRFAVSPDSKLVAAGSLDTIVRVWDTRTGQQVERLRGHKDSVYSVAFSPAGDSLVSGSLDKSLKVWDLRQTKLAAERAQPGHPSPTGLGVLQQTLVGHKVGFALSRLGSRSCFVGLCTLGRHYARWRMDRVWVQGP